MGASRRAAPGCHGRGMHGYALLGHGTKSYLLRDEAVDGQHEEKSAADGRDDEAQPVSVSVRCPLRAGCRLPAVRLCGETHAVWNPRPSVAAPGARSKVAPVKRGVAEAPPASVVEPKVSVYSCWHRQSSGAPLVVTSSQ